MIEIIKTTNNSNKDMADDCDYGKNAVRNKAQRMSLIISATIYTSFLYNLLVLCLHKRPKKFLGRWSVEF